jgi:hypothetical protein
MTSDTSTPAPDETVPLSAGDSQKLRDATVGAERIVVAIHGIGDQYRNATIQTVVSAFGRYARYPASMPLGFFHDESSTVRAFRLQGPPAPAAPLSTIGFVEVYWADIPRKAQTEGYIIEETKAWARTVVERVRARFGESAGNLDAEGPNKKRLRLNLSHHDYFAGADAIEEMVETFGVLDNLLFIAEKVGILKFDLGHLLTQYVGDVQLVADFANYRNNILDNFRNVLDQVYEGNKTAKIYFVAHSEGTVVAFMGLLEAMCGIARDPKKNGNAGPPGWIKQVRGLMTFGSPIDKHLILWPQIWDSLQQPHPGLAALRPATDGKIAWRNYYDYGDPVGFKLDTTRDWNHVHGWDKFFDFEEKHDHGFGRSLLPGAAHNDYWRDDVVFGHFIENVMGLKLTDGSGPRFQSPPPDKRLRRFGANVIPYLLVFAVLCLGSYLIFKGVITYLSPAQDARLIAAVQNAHGIANAQGADLIDDEKITIGRLILDVTGFSGLLAGMIALARIPRVTRAPKMIFGAILAFAAGAALYWWLVSETVHNFHALNQFSGKGWLNRHFFDWFGNDARAQLHDWGIRSGNASAGFIIVLAAAVAGFAAWSSRLQLRDWTTGWRATLRTFLVGTRPLILTGTFFVLLAIVYGAVTDDDGAHVLWPLMLAFIAFIYLWWLAILIFDLIFVWHRYIRFSVTHNYLFALRKEQKKRRTTPAAGPKPVSA